MNGKRARALRKQSVFTSGVYAGQHSRAAYRAAKRAAHADRGQHPKPLPERKHRRHDAVPPSWPRTEDQCEQSRPVIVLHPVRQLRHLRPWLARGSVWRHTRTLPKCVLDAMVLRHA